MKTIFSVLKNLLPIKKYGKPSPVREKVITYFENGDIHEIYTVDADGVKDGYYKEYSAKDDIKIEGRYIKGKKHGEWREYRIKYTSNYLDRVLRYKDDILDGRIDFYGVDGRVSGDGLYICGSVTYKNGILHGPAKGLHISNLIPSEDWHCKGMYNNGVKEGPWCYYYQTRDNNSSISSEGAYHNGIKVGVWKEYSGYEWSLLRSAITYQDGIPNDPAYEEKHGSGNYLDGKKDGWWTTECSDMRYSTLYKDDIVIDKKSVNLRNERLLEEFETNS